MKKLLLVFSIVVLLLGCQTLRSAETNQMEKSIFFEIAQNKIRELGIDTETMDYRDRTNEWKSFLQKNNDESQLNELCQKLKSKNFVAIYCRPKALDVMGGDIDVFIDRDTNEVIDVLRGQ